MAISGKDKQQLTQSIYDVYVDPAALLYHSREIISDCQIHIYVIGWN